MQATGLSERARNRLGRGARQSIVVALAFLPCACGGSSDPGKTIDSVHSWSATLALVRVERRRHSVPEAYARQLLDRARDARRDAAQSLASAQPSSADRGRADSALAALDAASRRLASELAAR